MGSNIGGSEFITITGVAILIVLLALLIKTSFNRRQQGRHLADQQFLERVRRYNLSVREYHILLDIVAKSHVRRKEAIFNNRKAFELGASRILMDTADKQGPEWEERFLAEMEFLREKMGFKVREHLDKTPVNKTKGERRLTTRHIPLGKTLRMTRRLGKNVNEITTTVVDNDEDHLTVTLDLPIRVTFNEIWRVHCFFGVAAWEFDTTVVSFEGNQLVLKHNDDVRFVNRRRFMRTPVSCPAYIAPFPFAQILSADSGVVENAPEPPLELAEGHVTELAGSGLLLETRSDMEVGMRVLVIMKMVDQRDPQYKNGLEPVPRVIQDIGIVRRVGSTHSGFALGIELIGMTDADLDELLRLSRLISFNEKAEAVLEDTLRGDAEKGTL